MKPLASLLRIESNIFIILVFGKNAVQVRILQIKRKQRERSLYV